MLKKFENHYFSKCTDVTLAILLCCDPTALCFQIADLITGAKGVHDYVPFACSEHSIEPMDTS